MPLHPLEVRWLPRGAKIYHDQLPDDLAQTLRDEGGHLHIGHIRDRHFGARLRYVAEAWKWRISLPVRAHHDKWGDVSESGSFSFAMSMAKRLARRIAFADEIDPGVFEIDDPEKWKPTKRALTRRRKIDRNEIRRAADAHGHAEIKRLAEARTFSNYGPVRGAQEVMLHVYWSAVNDARDKGQGHLMQRNKVCADLGLDAVPDPPFTNEEMQSIMFAAKIAAIKCLRLRKRKKG